MSGHWDLMFNALSNSNLVAPSAAAPASPLSTVVNSATTANGQPVFAQVVRDALNRSTNSAEGQQSLSSIAAASNSAQASTVSSSSNSTPALSPRSSKQSRKPQALAAANDAVMLRALLTPALFVPSQVVISENQTASTSVGATDSDSPTVVPAASADAGKQASPFAPDENAAIQFASQLQEGLSSAALVAIANSADDAASPVSSANSTESLDVSASAAVAGAAASAASAAAAAVAQTAAEVSVAATDPKALSAAAATTTTANSATASPTLPAATVAAATAAQTPVAMEKNGPVPQTSTSSTNSQQGQSFSAALHQIAGLQGPAPNNSSACSVTVDLAQTAAQSQLAHAAMNTALTASSAPHALPASTAAASSDAKGTRTDSLDTHSVDATQNAATAISNHSPSQDSSSNQGGQGSSDSAATSDSSVTSLVPAKNTSSDFSNALSDASAPRPDSASAAQTAAPPAPVIAAPAPFAASAEHSAADALPPAPAQTQSPLPALQTPDTALGRFVNNAQLTNAAGQSEMRIAMQTDNLGAIELHARVTGDQVGAAILVEKRDAHAALAVELPALQQALSDKQLRVEQVALTQGSLSSANGDAGANAQNSQRGMDQSPRQNSFWNETRGTTAVAWFIPEQTGVFNAQGRLSVQA